MRARFAVFITIVQLLLFLAHWLLYQTWVSFIASAHPRGISSLMAGLAVLSVTFVPASLLAWRYRHWLVRAFYISASAWLGMLTLLFIAGCLCWMIYVPSLLLGAELNMHEIASALLALAAMAGVYGIINAARVRVRMVSVKLPNLPESWRGRVAALISDLHLGPIRGHGFARRLVGQLKKLRPDILFIAGDLYDGTAADIDHVTRPLGALALPFGAYFVAGNHEQFRDGTQYMNAVRKHGMRVLNNEKVNVDGLQIVGVHYRDSTNSERFRSILRAAELDPSRSSILLTHAPDRPWLADEEGISLQLSGHTHGGQFFPFTLFASRIYGRFVHGLQRLGNALIYTSCGTGTWGPPLRVGTSPEIVLIEFA